MLFRNFKNTLIILCCLWLTSCHKELTYDYLVLHTDELEKAYSACQVNDVPECSEIKRAAHDMAELAYEQSKDPEAFGKHIMVQQLYLQTVGENKASPQIYDEQLQKLQMMYAVVASHGPR